MEELVPFGRPRYAFQKGQHLVIGNGIAYVCDSVEDAYALRDALKKVTVKRAAKRKLSHGVAECVVCSVRFVAFGPHPVCSDCTKAQHAAWLEVLSVRVRGQR